MQLNDQGVAYNPVLRIEYIDSTIFLRYPVQCIIQETTKLMKLIKTKITFKSDS